jgi:hypothetical protein
VAVQEELDIYYSIYSSGSGTTIISSGGGGGSGSEFITDNLTIPANTTINITVGNGGNNTQNISGGDSTFNYSGYSQTATGGSNGNFGYNDGTGALNTFSTGSGGNGGNTRWSGGSPINPNIYTYSTIPPTSSSDYNTNYENYQLNGLNIGTFGGGGGGGAVLISTSSDGSSGLDSISESGPPTGSGGGLNNINASNYGAGGAGGAGSQYPSSRYGGLGSDGIVIISFKNDGITPTPTPALNTNFLVNYGGYITDLSSIFYPRQDTDLILSYNTDLIVNDIDLTEIFYPYTNGDKVSQTFYITNGSGESTDLSQIFQNINVIPLDYTISNQSSNLSITSGITNGYFGILFENLNSPSTSPNYEGCNITFNTNNTINFLVVGGGGGGACGNTFQASGAGGGGAGIIYQTNFNVTVGDTYTVSVSNGGIGRKTSNGGNGGSAGYTGGSSNFYNNSINFSGDGGTRGLGIGTTFGYGGGPAGNSSNSDYNTTGGGGGGGGGGGSSPNNGKVNNAYTVPGYLNSQYNPGSLGSNGNSTNGGNGGNSYYTNNGNITIPFANNIVYCGNGGAGGNSNSRGGSAGSSSGGTAGTSGNGNGGNAVYGLNNGNYYFGNGGGGGASSYPPNTGGSGGNGVVIIWWELF